MANLTNVGARCAGSRRYADLVEAILSDAASPLHRPSYVPDTGFKPTNHKREAALRARATVVTNLMGDPAPERSALAQRQLELAAQPSGARPPRPKLGKYGNLLLHDRSAPAPTLPKSPMGVCVYDRRGNFIGVKLQSGACTQEDEAATTHHAETITAAPPAAVSEPGVSLRAFSPVDADAYGIANSTSLIP
jgi:hypothetical protein